MSAESTTAPTQETSAAAQTPPTQAAPVQDDALANLSDAEREDLEVFERVSGTPIGKVELLRLAREGEIARRKAAESAKVVVEKKPEVVAESETAKLRREMDELKGELAKKNAKEREEQNVRQFRASVTEALDAIESEFMDSDLRDEVFHETVGRFLSNPSLDVKKLAKTTAERKIAKLTKTLEDEKSGKRREYAASKARDTAATRGDAARGASPANVAKKYSGADFNSGKIADEADAEFSAR